MMKIGEKHGLLTCVAYLRPTTSGKEHVFRFACECGGTIDARQDNVRYGRTSSCGCVARKTRKMLYVRHISSPENACWRSRDDGVPYEFKDVHVQPTFEEIDSL